jgi:hypothetical protein
MNEEKCILWNHSGEITLTVLYSSTILTEGLLFKFELFWIQTNKDQAQAQKSGNNLPQCLIDTQPQEIAMKMGKVTRGPDGKCKAQGAWTIEDAVVSAPCSVEKSEPHQLCITVETESSEPKTGDCWTSIAASLQCVFCCQVRLRVLCPGPADNSISSASSLTGVSGTWQTLSPHWVSTGLFSEPLLNIHDK